MDVEKLLRSEIQSKLEEIGDMDVTSDQYKVAVENIVKLTDRLTELEKLKSDTQEKEVSRKTETNLKLKQMTEDRIDRIVRNSIAILGIAVPTLLTMWGTNKSLKFEETGTTTTTAGRNFLSRLFKK